MALEEIEIAKSGVKKSRLELFPSSVGLNYSITNIPSETFLSLLVELLPQLYDLDKQNLSKEDRRTGLSDSLLRSKIWRKYWPLFGRAMGDAGAEFKIDELAFFIRQLWIQSKGRCDRSF